MNRRDFLVGGGAMVAAGCTTAISAAQKPNDPVAQPPASESVQALLVSAPVLQNAAETSIGVSFAVHGDCCGWVDIGRKSDLSDATRVYAGAHGVRALVDTLAQVRVTGLSPATRYYYRIGADRISYKGGYAMRNLGAVADATIHSFTTLGAAARGRFCVINDTHNQKPAIDLVFSKLSELKPAVVLWNGDASNTSERMEEAMDIFITPHAKHPAYAADTPYMFLNGNHDFRGRFNRHLWDVAMLRELGERKPAYAELGRNFVQRLGDIALIGLDTGEDKLDTNPLFANLFQMAPYREKQARWLAEMIETPAVKTAKFRVAFCHIPLFDSNPAANPGDVAPADADPKYRHNFAIWQRTCANLWGPYFAKAGVQLVITAHQHQFRYDAPTPDRSWAQIVGGGPELTQPDRFPTVIEGAVEKGALAIRVHDVLHGKVVFDRTFS